MPVKSKDLHGNVPDQSGAALLLIDVVNDFEFEGGEKLLPVALPVGKAIAELKRAAKRAGVPAIYVNDNFGKWQSDLNKIVSHCLEDQVRGKAFVEIVLPDEDDYFVLKPKHSGFYSTTLEILLEHLGARSLILTGIALHKKSAIRGSCDEIAARKGPPVNCHAREGMGLTAHQKTERRRRDSVYVLS
ncbi:MAG: cysteine hydrolase family protein [Pyrinomonadaceae bacterium]